MRASGRRPGAIRVAAVLAVAGTATASPAASRVEELRARLLAADAAVRNTTVEYRVEQASAPEWIRELERLDRTSSSRAPGDEREPFPERFAFESRMRSDGKRVHLLRRRMTDASVLLREEIAYDGAVVRTYNEACRCGNLVEGWPLEAEFTPDRCGLGARVGTSSLRDILADPLRGMPQPAEMRVAEVPGGPGSPPLLALDFVLTTPDAENDGAPAPLLARIVVDPARGFLPVRVRNLSVTDPAGGPTRWLEEIDVLEFDRTADDGWTPRVAERRLFGFADGGGELALQVTQTLTVTSHSRNDALDAAAFTIAYPPGTRLLDAITNETFLVGGFTETGIDAMLERAGVPVRRGAQPPARARTSGEGAADATLREFCGPISLYIACSILGVPATLEELAGLSRTDASGTSMLGLVEAGRAKGLSARGVRLAASELPDLPGPAILHVTGPGEPHFVTVARRDADTFWILDYPSEPLVATVGSFETEWWDGATVLLEAPAAGTAGPAAAALAPAPAADTPASAAPAPPAAAGRGRLTFEEPSARLELPDATARATWRFDFRNIGDGPLRILHLEKSCACTQVRCPDFDLEPGEAGWIDVEVDMEGEAQRDVTVQVHTDEADLPVFPLFLTVTAPRAAPRPGDFSLVPSRLVLGEVRAGETACGCVRLVAATEGGQAPPLVAWSSDTPGLTIEEVPAVPPGTRISRTPARGARTLRVCVGTDRAPGPMRAHAELVAGEGAAPRKLVVEARVP